MNYIKPEITSLASASFAIQGAIPKNPSSYSDGKESFVTPSAYQADE